MAYCVSHAWKQGHIILVQNSFSIDCIHYNPSTMSKFFLHSVNFTKLFDSLEHWY